MAFDRDGTVIRGSDVVRFDWAEHIHKKFVRADYPNKPQEDHGFSDDELSDVFLETHFRGGKAAADKEKH